MLVVTDLSKLEKYGFVCCKERYTTVIWEQLHETTKEKTSKIYEKVLYEDVRGCISLLVNEYDNVNDNEIRVYCTLDMEEVEDFDECAPLDILFDMIKDRVVIKK